MTAVCDSWGNVTEMTYWGTDGRLGLNKEGFAKLNFKYDERGFREETAYFDVNNKLEKVALPNCDMIPLK